IQFAGGLREDGRICGNIVAAGSKPHPMLVLSERGVIEGKIKVPYMIINGTVKGPIHAEESLELQQRARISGDIHYKTIKIHQGSGFDGKMVQQENPQPKKLITFVASEVELNKHREYTE